MSTVRLGSEVHAPRTGAEDAPSVVLIGSLGSDRSMWAEQAAALSEEFRVVVVDLRGHGESEIPAGPYSIDDLANDVLSELDRLDIRSAHVVGLSIGGAVAQWLGVHYPDRVDSLTLICTAFKFGEPDNWRDRAATVRAEGVAAVADAVVARWLTPKGAEKNSELVARLHSMVVSTPTEGYAGCCESLAGFDISGDLARIDRPTLVIAGDEDPSTPPEVVRGIADRISGARFELLSPAAHVPTVEVPGQVNGLLRAHIRRVSATSGPTGSPDDS